jgi:hypothetical protein
MDILIVNLIFIIMLILFFPCAKKLLGLIRTLTFSFSIARSQSSDAVFCFGQILTLSVNLSAYNGRFQDVEYHYDRILERLNLLTLDIRRRHFDALFLINVFRGAKCCPCVLETVGLGFLLGTYVTLPRSLAPAATALQLDVFLLLIQFVNTQIFLITHV